MMSGTEDETGWEPATTVEALRQGRLVEHLSGSALILLAWVDDAPWAGSGLCPHQFARLSEGRIEGGRLHCPRHQASFCLSTGAPDDRWQITGIRLYATRVRDGAVEVRLRAPG